MNDRFKLRWPLLKDRTNRFIKFVYGDCFVGKPFDPPTKHFGEPQQCTGLKDKNGKLIYEGDLIKSPSNSHVLEVFRYIDGTYMTREYRKNGYNELPLYHFVAGEYGIEIVGNIHENKELLDEC